MSLMNTLGKLAMGVVVAKGLGKMMNNRQSGSTGGGGSLGDMLGGSSSSGSSSGGLGDMLGKMLGGQSGGSAGGSGGLGGMLGGKGGSSMGDLGALLGGRSGSGSSAGGGLAGGLGGLLESLGGGGSGAASREVREPTNGSFGDMLNSSLRNESIAEPRQEHEEHARLLIKAMINAAKSDGQIDQQERNRIVEHLDDQVTEADRQFVMQEMQSPLDLNGLVQSVPSGREHEVYLMSLMAIDLDHPDEAKYLDRLRAGLNLSESTVNEIHQRLGVPTLYN